MGKLAIPDRRHTLTAEPCTMASSTSLTPSTSQLAEGSQPTTIITKSSFPEIEPVSKARRSPVPHSSIPLQLQIHQVTEPFVSPLTETNLNYHKSNHSSSREAKCRLVESYIQDQRMLLEQEQYLQRKTLIEIRSMIPLDTTSTEEELVRDDVQQQHRLSTSSTDFSTRRQRRYSSLTHSWLSNNDDNERSIWTGAITSDEEDQHSTTQLDVNNKSTRTLSKRQWPKIFARWIGLGNDKKTGNNSRDENDRLEASTETAEPTVAVESTMEPTVAPAAPAAPREEEADSTQDSNQHQQSGIQRPTRKPARHVSWSVGTSYEEYKRQKAAMIEQGLYGLSNANIARALGSSQRGSKAPLLFQTDLTTTSSSRPDNPPLSTPTPSPHSQSTKEKDSGVSLVQQTLSSTRSLLRPRLSIRRRKVNHHVDSNDDAHQPSSTGNGDRNTDPGPDGGTEEHPSNTSPATHRNLSASERRRSAHIMDRYSPQLSALEEEDDLTTLMGPTLVAFRYPKMVRMKDLRDAAIHILSASEGEGDTNGKHKEPLDITGHHHSTSTIKHNQG